MPAEDSDERPTTDGPAGLSVPDTPPDPETDDHVLADEELAYPEFAFESGSMADDGSFDLETQLDREAAREWLAELAGGLASHDVAVRAPDGYAIFGVGCDGVSMSFERDPDAEGEHVGTLEVTLELPAKLMTHASDPDGPAAGARTGTGFIPLAMLTEDADPSSYRCYNWIADPLADRE